jgi:hypothetical protein
MQARDYRPNAADCGLTRLEKALGVKTRVGDRLTFQPIENHGAIIDLRGKSMTKYNIDFVNLFLIYQTAPGVITFCGGR